MNPGDKNKPLKKSLNDQQRKFNELLREKEAAVTARAAREQQEREDQEVRSGYKMPDGALYAGISPDTGKKMFTMPADAPQPITFNEAADYAAKLDAHGHKDWRLPTKGELNVLFTNRAAIGGFNVSGSNPAGWYWFATPGDKWDAWCQRFSDGYQYPIIKNDHSSVRLVRTETTRTDLLACLRADPASSRDLLFDSARNDPPEVFERKFDAAVKSNAGFSVKQPKKNASRRHQ
jgi:hypothetical protein